MSNKDIVQRLNENRKLRKSRALREKENATLNENNRWMSAEDASGYGDIARAFGSEVDGYKEDDNGDITLAFMDGTQQTIKPGHKYYNDLVEWLEESTSESGESLNEGWKRIPMFISDEFAEAVGDEDLDAKEYKIEGNTIIIKGVNFDTNKPFEKKISGPSAVDLIGELDESKKEEEGSPLQESLTELLTKYDAETIQSELSKLTKKE